MMMLKQRGQNVSSKNTRRARGTGTIFHDARKGVWIGRIPYGRTAAGNTLYRSVQRKTQAAVVAALRELAPPGPKTTLRDWAERWYSRLTIRPSTKADYRHTLDHFVLPTLGHVQVAALTAEHVEQAFRQWSQRLSPNTVRKNAGQLRACLDAARRAGLSRTNPAADARRPPSRRVHTVPFTPAELARVIDHPGAGILAFLAATGCRIGEALALDVADYAAGSVTISKTYSRAHGTRSPKSHNSSRTIRVPEQARPVVLEAIGRRTRGPLFASAIGTRRQHNTVRAQWKVMLRDLGLAYRRPHVLRHSVATALVAAGVPLADVARYLGDSVQVVVRTYTHATGTDPADTIEGVLGGRKVDKPLPSVRNGRDSKRKRG